MNNDDAALMEEAIMKIYGFKAWKVHPWFDEGLCQAFALKLGFKGEYMDWVNKPVKFADHRPLAENKRRMLEALAGEYGLVIWRAKEACRK